MLKNHRSTIKDFFTSELDTDLFESVGVTFSPKSGRQRKSSLFIFNKETSTNTIGQTFSEFITKEDDFQVFLYFAEQKFSIDFFKLLKLSKDFSTEKSKQFEEIEEYLKDPKNILIPTDLQKDYQTKEKKEVATQLYHNLLLQLSEIFYKNFFSSTIWEEYQKKKNEPPSKTVEDLLNRPEEFKLFKQFSQKEFNTENLEFMELYREYLQEKDIEKKQEKVKFIYQEYVIPEGTHWLNIPEKMFKRTEEKYKNGEFDQCLTLVESEVVKNLKDMYIRFTADPLWEDYKASMLNKSKQIQEYYKISSLVEKGDQCEIYKGFCKRKNYPYQIVKKFYENEEDLEKELLKGMTKLKHFNLVSIEDMFREDFTLYIVVKQYSETLDIFLQKERPGIQNLDEKLLDKFLQISATVQYLQSFGRYFELGELCEENIYMSNLYTHLFIDQDLLKKNRTIYAFKVPEDFPTLKGDIFQLGLIFLRMILVKKIENINDSIKKINGNEKIDQRLSKLIASMLDFNPTKRPEITKVNEVLLKLYEENKYKKQSIGIRGCLKNEKLRKLFKAFVDKDSVSMEFLDTVESFKKNTIENFRISKSKVILSIYVDKLNVSPTSIRFIKERMAIQEKFKTCLEDSFDFLVEELINGELSDLWDNFIETEEISKNYQNLVGSEEIWV